MDGNIVFFKMLAISDTPSIALPPCFAEKEGVPGVVRLINRN